MSWYADVLLQPQVKVIVLVIFGLYFAFCCWNASLLTQEFDVGSYASDDSYVKNVFQSLNDYSSVVRPIAVYFRNVDQSDPDVQQQMINYINNLESLPQVAASDNAVIAANVSWDDGSSAVLSRMDATEVRPFCWVRDFQQLEEHFVDQPPEVLAIFRNIEFAVSDKTIHQVYGKDIVRDEDGEILASRCFIFLRDLDLKDVEEQIDMLFDQRAVA